MIGIVAVDSQGRALLNPDNSARVGTATSPCCCDERFACCVPVGDPPTSFVCQEKTMAECAALGGSFHAPFHCTTPGFDCNPCWRQCILCTGSHSTGPTPCDDVTYIQCHPTLESGVVFADQVGCCYTIGGIIHVLPPGAHVTTLSQIHLLHDCDQCISAPPPLNCPGCSGNTTGNICQCPTSPTITFTLQFCPNPIPPGTPCGLPGCQYPAHGGWSGITSYSHTITQGNGCGGSFDVLLGPGGQLPQAQALFTCGLYSLSPLLIQFAGYALINYGSTQYLDAYFLSAPMPPCSCVQSASFTFLPCNGTATGGSFSVA